MEKKIHIGISGWSYYDWKGIYYPKDLKQTDWISFYSNTFHTTEINASFYRLPNEKTVLNWAAKVPPGFIFCPKMSKYLTHIKRLKEPEEPLERFFKLFSPIGDELGPVLLQLPPSLKYDGVLAKDFFEFLRGRYGIYDFAFEVRHDSWINDEAKSLMEANNIAFVISQSGVGFPYAEWVTAKNVYLRFHGPGKLYASSYSDEMIANYADKIKIWVKNGHTVWVYFNNCYDGVAINNAHTLERLLGIPSND